MEDELEQMLADGRIGIESYNKLKTIQNSRVNLNTGPKFIDEYYSNIKRNLGTDPDLTPDSGTEYQLNLSPEELKTYTSRGIAPSTLFDYEDARAQRQSVADKWGNGLTKFLGKTATATVGGIGMIGSIANNVAGQIEDGVMSAFTGREGDTSFHEIYDNGFYRALDEANKEMDSALPHYVTKAEQDYNLLQSLGTANFWSNDFLQGASFVTAAVLTEGLMSWGAEATGLRVLPKALQRTRELTGTSIADITTGAESLFARSAAAQTGLEAATVARQIITGAGYESSVEAMSFVDDAKREWLNNYKYQNGPDAEPTEQETAEAMSEIYGVANSVFGINLLVVGLTQAKTLPGMFAPNIASTKLGKLLGASKVDDEIYEGIVATKTLSNRELLRASKKLGKSVDEIKAMDSIAKYDAMSTLGKIRKGIARGGEGLVIEGGQEGLQKAINYAGLDYLNDRMDPNGIEDVLDSGLTGLAKAFGNNAESWKEIFIGALLGGIGGPSKTRGWEGGVIEGFRAPNKSPRFQGILDQANNYATNSETIINNFVKQANLSSNVQRKKDRAQENGDVQDYTTQEAKEAFNYFNMMSRLGRQAELEDNVLEKLNTLSKKEFQERFGYANLTKNDFAKRKLEISEKIKKEIADTNDSMDKARSIYRGQDPDVIDAIGYTIYSTKNLDNREEVLATEVSKLTGIIDPRTLIEISRDNQRLKLKDGWLTSYRNKVNALKAARSYYTNKLQDAKALDKTEQIVELENKIKAKEKELNKLLKQEYSKRKELKKSPNEVEYELNFDEFVEKVNKNVEFLNNVEKHYSDNAINAAEVKDKLAQLKTVAKTRERFIGDFNRLLTEEGVKELEDQIELIRGHYKKEQVDLETMLVMEGERAKNPATELYKAQEAAFKFKNKGLPYNTNEASNTSEKIKALENVINNLPPGPSQDMFKDAMKQVLAKLNSSNVDDIEPYLTNIYAALFNDEANTTPEAKNVLSTIRLAFDEIIAYFKAPKSLAAITSLNRFFKVYAPEGFGIDEYLANTFTHPSDFKVTIEELDPNSDVVKNAEASNRILPLKNPNKEQILTPFVGLQSLIKRNGKYYAIKLNHKNQFVGYILDPNRFKFKNIDTGAYEDFNPRSLAHLRLINPLFVNKGVITDEGKEFINGYIKGKEMFKMFEDAIDSGKVTISTRELLTNGFLKFDSTFNKYEEKEPGKIMEEFRNSPEIYNLVPPNEPRGIEVREGEFVIAPFMQVKKANKIEYYYYDKADDSIKKVTYEGGVDKLNELVKVTAKNSQFGLDSSSNFIKVIVPTAKGYSPISVKIPTITSEVGESEFIDSFKEYLDEFRGKPKGSFKYKSNFLDINIVGFTSSDATVKIKIFADSVNDKGTQWVKAQITVNGSSYDIILNEIDEFDKIGSVQQLVDLLNKKIDSNRGKVELKDLPSDFAVTGFNRLTQEADLKEILRTGVPSLLVGRSIAYLPNDVFKPSNTTNTTAPESSVTPSALVNSNIPDEGDIDSEEWEEEEPPAGTVEQTPTTETDPETNNTEDDDPFDSASEINFKIDREISEYEESVDDRSKNTDNLLPSWIPVRDIQNLKRRFRNEGFTYGVFVDNVIYLAKNAPKGVEYHEAFHAVFRTLLSDAQISKVYSEARIKYGIPTAEQLTALKNSSNLYQKLNKEELTNLWYEEQLADDFQKFMLKPVEPKSFIQKIFDKILRFIRWVTNNKNYIDYLFEDIQSGAFKNAKQSKNRFYQKSIAAFKVLSFEEEYNGQKRTRNLDSKTTSNVTLKILKEVFDLDKSSVVTNIDIQNIIERLKDTYYTEDNFSELFKLSTAGRVASAKKQLAQVRNALANPKNIDSLVKDVKNLLKMYKIVDYTLEGDEDQDNTDLPTEFFAKEVSTIGGIGSLSKEMRKYLQFIPSPVDEFNLGVNIDPSSQFVSYADAYELYNGIARILANRKPSEIIKALYSQTKTNPQLKYFAMQLFSDIASDLKLDNVNMKEISNLSLLTLENSTTFQMFVANFRKNKVDYISITPDIENNRFKLFRSNMNDVKDVQVDSWGNNNLSNPVSSTDQAMLLNSIDFIFTNLSKGEDTITNEEKFLKTAASIQEKLKGLHIEVSDLYVKMSLFNALPNKLDLAAKETEEGLFTNLSDTLSVYPELSYLNSKITTGMLAATKTTPTSPGGGSIYEKTKSEDSAAITTLKNIAEANTYFDFTIIPTTFKNIEGKTIYSYIQPNYITDIVNSFKDNAEVVLDALKDPDEEVGYQNFKAFLINNNLESNDYLQRLYYNALRYNPMLSVGNSKEFLNNIQTFILDGSRVVTMDENFKELTYLSNDDGKSFQSLDPRGKILTYFMLFATKTGSRNTLAKTIDGTQYVPYIPFQNEGKSTQWSTLMPKKEYYSEGKLSNEAYEKIFRLFQLEHSNIRTFLDAIKNDKALPLLKGVNQFSNKALEAEVKKAVIDNDLDALIAIYKDVEKYSSLPRAMKFSNLEYLHLNDNIDYVIAAALAGNDIFLDDTSKKSIDTLMDSVLDETLDLISSDSIKLITKLPDGEYTNVLLPKEFLFSSGKVDKSTLKNFLVNDYINSASFMNMLIGDMNVNFKDAIDFPKRMAGLNASGASLGVTKSNVTIIKDIEKSIDGREESQSTDGQSYATQTWYERKYLKTFKKWNNKIESIYMKMRKCQRLSWSEKELLEEYGALANSRKIALFNYALYGKTSINPITRNEVSYVAEENKKIVSTLVKKLYKTNSSEEYQSIIEELHNYYLPLPQTVEMHNLLNKMEKGQTDIALHSSAVKTVIYNVQDFQDPNLEKFENIIMGDTYIREQVVTDNMKTKIVDGTQLLQLIDSEQESKTMVSIYGKEYSIGTIVSVFKKTKEYRVKQTYDNLKKSYSEKDKPRYKALLKSFQESLLAMGTDPIMLELLSASENLDSPKFNWNMQKTINNVEKMLYSYLSASLSHKVAGQKFTLLSDFSYNVIEDSKGRIITTEEFKNNPSIEHGQPRELQIQYDSDKKCYYAECVISAQTAYRYGLKPGDELEITDKKLLEYIATRIPTQEKSSMAYLKVVDYLPIEKGNSIILPFEVMTYSGADFDIDSLFAQSYETFEDGDKEILFGSYLNIEDTESRLKAAFKEYYKEVSKSKGVQADYDYFLSQDEEYAKLLKKFDYLEKALSSIEPGNMEDLVTFVKEELPDYEKEIKEFFNNTKDFTATLSYIENNISPKKLSKTAKEVAAKKEAVLKIAIKRNGYPNTFEEFIQNTTIVNQVNNNYKAIKEGNLLAYNPITTSETNNLMVELKSVLIRNEGNKESSKRDVERKAAKELTKKLKKFDIKDPTSIAHYVSLISKAKMSIANAVGRENIGIAALGNIMAQYLMENKIEIKDVGTVANFKWKNSNTYVNKILSLWITLGVDNAKHQDAGRFFISKQMQSVLVFDAIINKDNAGYTAEHIMSLGLVPEVQKMLNELTFVSNKFKTKEESKLTETKNEILTKYYKPTNINWENLTIEDILSNISALEKGNSVDPDFQQAALNKIIKLMKVADYSLPFTQLLGLIKGNKTTTAENLQILGALDSLGIEIIEENGKYELKNTIEYEFYKNNKDNPHPIDFLQIINSDSFLKEEIITFYKLNKDAGLFLIAASKDGQEIYKKISKNLKKNFFFNEANVKRLVNLINNSLAFTNIKFRQEQQGKSSIDPSAFITASPEDVPGYIKAFNKLKASPQLANNFLLKNLKAEFVEGKDGSPLDGKTVHYIATNSFLNISPNMKKQIADDMYDLFAGNIYNEDGSINKELSDLSTKFIATLINQIYQKDAGLFVNQTLLPYMEPFFLNNYSRALNEVQEAIRGEASYEDTLGMSKEEFSTMFMENFMRDFNNGISVRGNRLDFILNIISKSISSELNNLQSLEDIEDVSDLVEKVKKISEGKATKEDYELVSPLVFDENKSKFTLYISPKASNENRTDFMFDQERRSTLGKIYRNAIIKTGLVNATYQIKDGKKSRKIEFLDYIVINSVESGKRDLRDLIDQSQQKSNNVRRWYKKVSNDTWKADYVEVAPYGSKVFAPYYFTPKKNEQIFSMRSVGRVTKPAEVKTNTPAPSTTDSKPTITPEGVSGVKQNLYNFLKMTGVFKASTVKVTSLEDYNARFDAVVKASFDALQQTGRLAAAVEKAKNGEVIPATGGVAIFSGSAEFLTFADAYEKSKLEELINKCK